MNLSQKEMQYKGHNKLAKLPGFTGHMSLCNSNCYAGETHSVHHALIMPSVLSGAACAAVCAKCLNGLNLLPEGVPVPRGLKSKCNLCSSCGGGEEPERGEPMPSPLCGYICTFDGETGLECHLRCPGDF